MDRDGSHLGLKLILREQLIAIDYLKVILTPEERWRVTEVFAIPPL